MSETTTADPASADQTTPQTSSTTEQTQSSEPWYSALPEDLKTSAAVTKYKDVEQLARGLVAAENRLGVPADQLLRKPKGMDDKDGLTAVMKALGAPDSPDGYKLELGDGASEADLALAKDFAKHMHAETNAPPHVVAAALKWFGDQNASFGQAQKAAAEQQLKDGEAALRQEWGQAYDSRFKEVGRLMNENGGSELYAELEKNGLANNPKLLTVFGKLLDRMAEPGALEGGDRGTTPGVLTPGQARAKLADFNADPLKQTALNDANHSNHKAVLEERRALMKAISGQA